MWFHETVLSKTSFLQIERWVVSSGKLPVCAVIYSKLGCESASYILRKVIMGVIQFRTSFIPEITCFNILIIIILQHYGNTDLTHLIEWNKS